MKNYYKLAKDKIKNTKYDFAKNLFYHLIAPAVIIIVGLIVALCANFNLGMDFNGGTVITVVSQEDLTINKNYQNFKKDVDSVLKKNNVCGEVYQMVNTSYYGDAITVKFEGGTKELREQLRKDLISQFYSTESNEDELAIKVKVDSFAKNVSREVILASAIALLSAIVVAFIYISSRYGISAGMISLVIALFDLVVLTGVLAITRVNLNLNILTSYAICMVMSILYSMFYFGKVKDNLKLEIYAKTSNNELANISVKDSMKLNALFTAIMLIFTFFMGILPTYQVRGMSLPILFGIFISLYSSMFITPGLWNLTYVRKDKSKKKQETVVVEETNLESLNKEPEVIVETEAKE